MVDFERGTPILRDGVRSMVDEYSLSVAGPSPRAAAHIRQGRDRGMTVMTKVQVGNTWELSLLPYIPVPHLVARKFAAMREAGVAGATESWTLGAYPSLNWRVARHYYGADPPEPEEAVRREARNLYGEGHEDALQAWGQFAEAFEQYPFSNSLVYSSVVQNGPAHPWWWDPSGQKPRILNSYDDLGWTAPFGPERTARLFSTMADRWEKGLVALETAMRRVPAEKRLEAARDRDISMVVSLYFRSIANHIRFHSNRDRRDGLAPLLRSEIRLAERLLRISRSDSRVGFEASLQYFYLPLDIREKIASCRWMLDNL